MKNLVILIVLLHQCYALAVEGRVVGVTDGDTVTVLVERSPVKCRLYGIDAPEKKQAFGTKAKESLSKMVFNSTVTVEFMGSAGWGRKLCRITYRHVDVGRAQVTLGMAWWYRKYAPKDKAYAWEESMARKRGVGLWRDKDPVPPWEFRKQNKQGATREVWSSY